MSLTFEFLLVKNKLLNTDIIYVQRQIITKYSLFIEEMRNLGGIQMTENLMTLLVPGSHSNDAWSNPDISLHLVTN